MDCLNKLCQTIENSLHPRNLQNFCVQMVSNMLGLPLTTLPQTGQWKGLYRLSSKQAIKAGEGNGFSLQHHLQTFLMTYRSTPCAKTGLSLASFFLGRPIRTRFDLLLPNVDRKVAVALEKQKSYHDRKDSLRQFTVGARVMLSDGRDKSH